MDRFLYSEFKSVVSGQFRQKSASVGSYSSHFLSRRQQPLFQRQHQYANKLQNGISMDQGQMVFILLT